MDAQAFLAGALGSAIAAVGVWLLFFRERLASKQARIEQLEDISAPHLASQNEELSRFVDRSAQQITALQEKLQASERAREKVAYSLGENRFIGLSLGLMEGAGAIREIVQNVLPVTRKLRYRSSEQAELYRALVDEFEALMKLASQAASGKEPALTRASVPPPLLPESSVQPSPGGENSS